MSRSLSFALQNLTVLWAWECQVQTRLSVFVKLRHLTKCNLSAPSCHSMFVHKRPHIDIEEKYQIW